MKNIKSNAEKINKMTPVLKWAGGKKQLLDVIVDLFPANYKRYFEPFIGGGAVLFRQAPQCAFINDTNEQLINLYQQLKTSSLNLIQLVNELDARECDKEFFYQIREKYNAKILQHSLDTECVAFMIWLNKHCFNGLYRVNSKGLFNVPYNNKQHGTSIDVQNIKAIGNYLNTNDIKITCLDFEEACKPVKRGDFVYFDSPYVPESLTADFTDYTSKGFSLHDHQRLAQLFIRLDKRGVKLMLSNNDVPLVRELYAGFNLHALDVKRMINRDAKKRTGKELIVTNY